MPPTVAVPQGLVKIRANERYYLFRPSRIREIRGLTPPGSPFLSRWLSDESAACLFGAREGFGGVVGEDGEVPHLAAGAGLELAVEVQLDVGHLANGGPVGFAFAPEVSQKISHRRRAEQFRRSQGETANGA